MTRQWIWLAAACGAIALAGGCNCGNPDPITPNTGADAGGDAGGDADGGITSDAGDDGGLTMDGGDDGGMDQDGGADDGGMDQDGGADDGGMTGEDAGITPNTLCEDVAKKKCDFFIRCVTDTALEARFGNNPLNQGRANDQVTAQMRAECEAFELDVGCRVLAASAENGRSTLDTTKYQQCIDAAYPANTCARDFNLVSTACVQDSFIVAASGNGSLCTFDGECTNGYCAKTGSNVCGTCTAYVAVGQNCPNGNECDPAAAYCPQGFNPKCTAFTASGAGCTQDRECGPGNVCQASTGNAFQRTCKAGVPLGGACTGGHFECLREPLEVPPGNPNGAVPTALCSSQSGAGTCIATQSALGGVCGNGERFNANLFTTSQGPVCNETEFCASGLCISRRSAGGPCDGDEQCVAGTHCVNSTCTAYKELGAGCSGNSDCKNFMNCQGATCQPVLSMLGEPCNNSQPCAEGYCDSGSNTCAAFKADGDACGGNGECESLLCMGGMCTAACWQ